MVADTHAKGTIYLLAGSSINQWRVLAALDSEIADNAAGSNPYFLLVDGVDPETVKTQNDGQFYKLPSGPHLFSGELLILAIEPNAANTAADVDTTGANSDAYEFSYWEYSHVTKQSRKIVITDESTRNTTTGVAPPTDPALNQGQITATHAWGPVPPNADWTLDSSRVLIDLRSAS